MTMTALRMTRSWRSIRGATYNSKQEEQNARADERDEDDAGKSAEWRGYAERAEDPSADEGANDADDDVPDQTVASADYK